MSEAPEQSKEEPSAEGEESEKDIRAKIADMKFPEKLKLAMLGNSVVRGLLIFDSNKLVSEAVLNNPRITTSEVEDFTKNPNLSKDIIRKISTSKDWMKQYPIKKNILFNPKTPPDVSLKWLKFLQAKDLRELSRSKNLPSVIVTQAKKLVAAKNK